MRFVDAAEIRRVLNFPHLITALEVAHRRPKIEIQDGFLGGENGHYFVRHAVDRVDAARYHLDPAGLAGGRRAASGNGDYLMADGISLRADTALGAAPDIRRSANLKDAAGKFEAPKWW